MNRVTVKTVPASASGAAGDAVHYGHDVRDLQRYARCGAGVTHSHEGVGRRRFSTSEVGGVSRTLGSDDDADGRRTRRTSPDDTLFRDEPDAAGRLTAIVEDDGSTAVATFGRDVQGRRSSASFAGTVVSTAEGSVIPEPAIASEVSPPSSAKPQPSWRGSRQNAIRRVKGRSMNVVCNLVLFVLALVMSVSMSATAADAPAAENLARWQREDLQAYRNNFLAIDRSFSATARAAAEARLSRMENASRPLSPIEFAVELCRITALADNAHTQCLPSNIGRLMCERFAALIAKNSPWCNLRDPDFAVPDFTRLSITFQPFGEDFHVVRVSSEHADLLGAKLLSIEGQPIERIRPILRTFSGGTDAHRDAVAAGVLASPPQLHAVALSKTDDSLRYEFLMLDGRQSQRRFNSSGLHSENANERSIPAPDRAPWSLREPGKPFRFRDEPALDSLVVQLRQVLDTQEEGIAAFIERMERHRAELGRQNIVLDMRQNGGGNLLTARDFMVQWPTRVPGKFYVLTSRQTFSAAIASIAYLKQAGTDRVVIIGEPVGDRLMFFSDGLPVQLPHSGLFFLPAVVRMDYENGCREYTDCFAGIVEEGRPTAVSLLVLPPDLERLPISVKTLKPDVSAPWTVRSWIEGMDPAMEAIDQWEHESGRTTIAR